MTVISLVVLASALPYIRGLGFYSDDWWNLAILAQLHNHDFASLLRRLLEYRDYVLRPGQPLYLAIGYRYFGEQALPYHVVDVFGLALTADALYLVLTEVFDQRGLPFVIAIMFGLLPHYSTDRFWIMMHSTTYSMAFAFLGVYSLFRWLRSTGRHAAGWVVLALMELVASILCYEVALGLIAASIFFIGWRRYTASQARAVEPMVAFASVTAIGAPLVAVLLIKAHMQTRIAYHHHFFVHLGALLWHAITQAFQFNFWTYGIHMPVVLAALWHRGAINMMALFVSVILALAVVGFMLRNVELSEVPSVRTCLLLLVFSLAFFGLGYGLFLPSIETNFSTMGLANRVAIASAVGAALVPVAFAGLLSSLFPDGLPRRRVFVALVGLFCGVNSLVVSGIASFWIKASEEQKAIVHAVASIAPAPPHGSVLLLDGVCKYVGPGIVFEGDDDSSSAIQMATRDFSSSSDVISPNLHFDEDGVNTTMYGQPEHHYDYGELLFVYNLKNPKLTSLPTREAAESYMRSMNPDRNGGCPEAHEGDGENILRTLP